MGEVNYQPSPMFMGLPITPRFSEALGVAQEKQDRQQMTYTKSSTQDREYSPAGFEKNLYEKSDIYHTTKDAITAPMRAIEGTLDVNSPQGVEEAMGTAGMGMLGSMPGGARGAGSLGVVRSYKEFFEPKVVEQVNSTDFKSRGKIIELPIDDFLSLVYPLEKPDAEKTTNLTKVLSTEKLKEPLYLQFDHEGRVAKVHGHEGRHRALALKAAGVETVPVEVRSSRIRWSEQDDPSKFDYLEDWPDVIKSEDGKKTLPFFIKRGNQ